MAKDVTSAIDLMPRVVLVNRCILIGKDNKILLIQRSAEDPWLPGKWEFPGGKLDPGQSPTDALERELWEETHLTMTPISRQAYAYGKILTEGKYAGLPFLEIIGIANLQGGRLTLSKEHQDSGWKTIEEAYSLELTDETRKALGELEETLNTKHNVV